MGRAKGKGRREDEGEVMRVVYIVFDRNGGDVRNKCNLVARERREA